MKHSEKELEQKLSEKIDWLSEKNDSKPKTIPVSINGTIVNVYEGMLKPVCEKPKTEHTSDNITPVDIVEDVLAYKKAQLQKRKENCQCKGNVCICTDDDECADECCSNNMIEDSCFDEDDDFKTPYEKMSYHEQEELKDILKKSKSISSSILSHKENKNPFVSFKPVNEDNLSGMLPDEKLIKEWKEYKERVDDFVKKHPKLPKTIVNAMMLDEYPENKKEPSVESPEWCVDEFENITTQMFDTYKKKNADYGSSFDDLFDEFGMTSALIRMKDKYNRLKSITEKKDIQVKDESVEDTLLDLANYCILTVIKLRKDKKIKK